MPHRQAPKKQEPALPPTPAPAPAPVQPTIDPAIISELLALREQYQQDQYRIAELTRVRGSFWRDCEGGCDVLTRSVAERGERRRGAEKPSPRIGPRHGQEPPVRGAAPERQPERRTDGGRWYVLPPARARVALPVLGPARRAYSESERVTVRTPTEEANGYKAKFDKLSELYASMRNDHIVLLQQKKQFQAAQASQAKAAQAVEQLQKVRATGQKLERACTWGRSTPRACTDRIDDTPGAPNRR